MRRYLPKDKEELIRWYERYVSPGSLIVGFIFDSFAVRRIDLLFSNIVLLTYLALATLGIVLVNLVETGRLRHPLAIQAAPFLPVVVQFGFGGLFSAYFLLYMRSANIPASWVFVVILAGLLLGNERFRKLYTSFTVQITILFTVLYAFLTFFIPVVTRSITPYSFYVSGALALLVTTLAAWVLQKLAPELVRRERLRALGGIGAVFLLFNMLYVLNAIPPLPLALKDAGVFHSVERTGEGYEVAYEETPWYTELLRFNSIYRHLPGEPVYVYTAIFAPSRLSIGVVHEWQYRDRSGEWQTRATVRFPVSGGRDGGYRGYSLASDPEEGEWRVNVKTEYGRVIGRIAFTVVDVSELPELKADIR